MNKRYLIIKIMLVIFVAFGLFGCSKGIELTHKEVQLYEGQEINPINYLGESFKSNDKIKISNNANTKLSGNYEIVYKLDGAEAVLKVVVLSDPVTLTSQKVILETGSSFNPKDYISNEDRNNDIKIVSNVDLNKAGEYIVVYSFSGIEKVLNVSVKNVDIVLTQTSISIDLGSTFNPKAYLAGNFPNSPKISIQSNVDTNKIGTYQVKYSTSTDSKTLNVTVKDVSPILTKTSVSINQGTAFDPKSYLVSEDRNNTNIVITNKVDTSVPGTYLVTYQLGQIVKTLSVTVVKVATATPTPTPSTSYSLKVISLTSPVDPGDYATIVVQGKAGKQYSIVVYYKSGPSTAAGLEPKIADASGQVSWTWKIGTRTSAGSWKITISGDGKTTSTYIKVN
jgi:hypothetical protein